MVWAKHRSPGVQACQLEESLSPPGSGDGEFLIFFILTRRCWKNSGGSLCLIPTGVGRRWFSSTIICQDRIYFLLRPAGYLFFGNGWLAAYKLSGVVLGVMLLLVMRYYSGKIVGSMVVHPYSYVRMLIETHNIQMVLCKILPTC